MFIKGIDYIGNRQELLRIMYENDVIWSGVALAHMIIMTHLLGGLLMAVGFGTRVGALIQIPTLFGAVFLVHGTGAGQRLRGRGMGGPGSVPMDTALRAN